ncbi:hypothetical protein RQM65_02755 [Pricia sp. S334]|uniref:Uncharacterized protein n=1 Tax=Pricia mediterranea TaxID=3076079 RepID=A0ABU3L1I0_9FLAO|nr:hypothetical protein [Pricia sp. S334]MDT7827584.1 hypothetical protein [Pricia sp. S334]
MDKNRKYREEDAKNDEFTGQSNLEKKDADTAYVTADEAGRNDAAARDYDDSDTDYYDDSDTDYEDLEDQWYEIEDEYRTRYSDITDEDVKVEPGRFDRTVDRIARRRGKTPNEIRDEIDNW